MTDFNFDIWQSRFNPTRQPPQSLSQFSESQQENVSPYNVRVVYDRGVDEILNELNEIKESISQIIHYRPFVVSNKIYSLPSEQYKLKFPIDIVIKIHENETIAIIPDLEIYGEGSNEFEAVNELKWELVDLLDHLMSLPEDELGDGPKSWKRTLELIVEKCQ